MDCEHDWEETGTGMSVRCTKCYTRKLIEEDNRATTKMDNIDNVIERVLNEFDFVKVAKIKTLDGLSFLGKEGVYVEYLMGIANNLLNIAKMCDGPCSNEGFEAEYRHGYISLKFILTQTEVGYEKIDSSW